MTHPQHQHSSFCTTCGSPQPARSNASTDRSPVMAMLNWLTRTRFGRRLLGALITVIVLTFCYHFVLNLVFKAFAIALIVGITLMIIPKRRHGKKRR